ncbi:hypothetical protein [Staphylospora marina]|uniref:hypothetical protein n=1 Tax=Staphylospora marina TaxID=2490858 RepID=UPI000F5C1702|nr:hypothetical protein [Staphylospora marina]
MGSVIHMSELRAAREEQLRLTALRLFPWDEMDRVCRRRLSPFYGGLSEQKRVILLEMTYRLAYEAFLSGMRNSLKTKKRIRPSEEQISVEVRRLVREVKGEFGGGARWIGEGGTLEFLLMTVAEEWFGKGTQVKVPRS